MISAFQFPCRSKYEEHYRIVGVRVDLLEESGKTEKGQTRLAPLTQIVSGKEFYIHFLFSHEYFNLNKKARAYPRLGSKGPVDTLSSMQVTLVTGNTTIVLDTILKYEIDGKRVWLDHENPLPNKFWSITNPIPSFSHVKDFIDKYNARHESVLFEELESNGMILKGKVSLELSSTSVASIIAVITFTDGRVLSDTLQTQLVKR